MPKKPEATNAFLANYALKAVEGQLEHLKEDRELHEGLPGPEPEIIERQYLIILEIVERVREAAREAKRAAREQDVLRSEAAKDSARSAADLTLQPFEAAREAARSTGLADHRHAREAVLAARRALAAVSQMKKTAEETRRRTYKWAKQEFDQAKRWVPVAEREARNDRYDERRQERAKEARDRLWAAERSLFAAIAARDEAERVGHAFGSLPPEASQAALRADKHAAQAWDAAVRSYLAMRSGNEVEAEAAHAQALVHSDRALEESARWPIKS